MHTYIQTDKNAYRHTDTQIYIHTYSYTGIQSFSQTDRHIQADRHAFIYTDIHAYKHTDRHAYRHTDRHTDIQTDRQTERHRDIPTYIETYRQTPHCNRHVRIAISTIIVIVAVMVEQLSYLLKHIEQHFVCPAFPTGHAPGTDRGHGKHPCEGETVLGGHRRKHAPADAHGAHSGRAGAPPDLLRPNGSAA